MEDFPGFEKQVFVVLKIIDLGGAVVDVSGGFLDSVKFLLDGLLDFVHEGTRIH